MRKQITVAAALPVRPAQGRLVLQGHCQLQPGEVYRTPLGKRAVVLCVRGAEGNADLAYCGSETLKGKPDFSLTRENFSILHP